MIAVTTLSCEEACNHKNSDHDKKGLQVDICLLLLPKRSLAGDAVGVPHMPTMESMAMTKPVVKPSRLGICSWIWKPMHLEAEHREQAPKCSRERIVTPPCIRQRDTRPRAPHAHKPWVRMAIGEIVVSISLLGCRWPLASGALRNVGSRRVL